MTGIREFGDAARAAVESGEDASDERAVPINVLGREIWLEYPGSGALALLAGQISVVQNDLEGAGHLINFIMSLVDDEDGRYIRAKLLDRKSGFDANDIADIATALMEEWADGNPTSGPSVSSRQRPTTGANSTVAQRRSQSSRSRSRGGASSTGSTPTS